MFKKQADSIGAFLTKKIFDQAKVVEIIRAKITLYQKSRKIIPHLRIFQSDQPEGIFYAMNESKIENICGRVTKEELEKYKTVYVGEKPDKSYDYDSESNPLDKIVKFLRILKEKNQENYMVFPLAIGLIRLGIVRRILDINVPTGHFVGENHTGKTSAFKDLAKMFPFLEENFSKLRLSLENTNMSIAIMNQNICDNFPVIWSDPSPFYGDKELSKFIDCFHKTSLLLLIWTKHILQQKR